MEKIKNKLFLFNKKKKKKKLVMINNILYIFI